MSDDINSSIDEFITACKEAKQIEIADDIFIGEGNRYIILEDQIGLSKSFYKEVLQYSIQYFDKDPDRLSIVGLLIGTRDDRAFKHRKLNRMENIIDEIHLHHLCLTVSPKSAGAFDNIRYFLKKYANPEILSIEREFCNFLTSLRPRNAILWRHRVWIAKTFNTKVDDLQFATQWVKKYPQDCSAFFFIENFMNLTKEDVIQALAENTQMIFFLPGHESIWHHRRFLLQNLIDHFSIPDGWFEANSPIDTFVFPLIEKEFQQNNYGKICKEFCIDISGIYTRLDISQEENIQFDIRNEDIIIGLARGDKYPAEAEKQRIAAEKHYKWLHVIFTKLLKNK